VLPVGGGVLDGGFGFVELGGAVFGVVVFGLVFGLVPFGFVWLGVSLGACPFIFPLVSFGLVVPGSLVFGFVVPGLPVLGVVVPGLVVPGVAPVGGFTEPVGGGGGVVAPGVRDWPLCPAAPGAVPPVAEPPGDACATIQLAQSKTTESKLKFLIDMMEGLQARSATIDPQRGRAHSVSVGAERKGKYPGDALEPLRRKGTSKPSARQERY